VLRVLNVAALVETDAEQVLHAVRVHYVVQALHVVALVETDAEQVQHAAPDVALVLSDEPEQRVVPDVAPELYVAQQHVVVRPDAGEQQLNALPLNGLGLLQCVRYAPVLPLYAPMN
jgi:hypothetical protein